MRLLCFALFFVAYAIPSSGIANAVEISRNRSGQIVRFNAYEKFMPTSPEIEQIPSSSSLEELIINNRQGEFTVPSNWLDNKPKLWHLTLVGCRIDSDLFSKILNHPPLKSLVLKYCVIDYVSIDSVSSRPILVDLAGCQLSDNVLRNVVEHGLFDRACRVLLTNNPVSSKSCIPLIEQIDDCEELRLNKTLVDDTCIPSIGRLVHLNSLNLNDSKIVGKDFEQLAGLSELEHLYAAHVKLSAKQVMPFMVNCPKLIGLEFDYSEIPEAERRTLYDEKIRRSRAAKKPGTQ